MILNKLGLIVLLLIGMLAFGQNHPNLILTSQGVKDIKAQLGTIPIFDHSLKAVQDEVDEAIVSTRNLVQSHAFEGTIDAI